MSAETHHALQQALIEHVASEFPDEPVVITAWTLAGATMNAAGEPGAFREDSGYHTMPAWHLRGLLEDARRRIYATGTVE
jgi:hypothetical protein